MSTAELQALQNAAASSAMEGLPLSREDMDLIERILKGETSLQAFLSGMKAAYGDV